MGGKAPIAALAPVDAPPAPVDDVTDDLITEADVAALDDGSPDAALIDDPIDDVADDTEQDDESTTDTDSEDSEDSEKASATAPPATLPANWRETEQGKAVLEELRTEAKRELRPELEQAILKRIDSILTDPDKEGTAASYERRIVNKLRANPAPSVEQAVEQKVSSLYQPFESLQAEYLSYVRHYGAEAGQAEFGKLLMSDPERNSLMVAWQKHLAENNIPLNATVEQVRTRALESERRRVAAERAAQARDADPDDVFDDYHDAPEWGQLTAEQQAALHPNKFTGSPLQKTRQMAELWGEYRGTLKAKGRRAAALAEAKRLNGQNDIAEDLAGRLPPTVSGQMTPLQSYYQLRDRVQAAREENRSTPKMEAELDKLFERVRYAG